MGVPLGTGGLADAGFESAVFDLLPGDRLVLYTDCTDGLVGTRGDALAERFDLPSASSPLRVSPPRRSATGCWPRCGTATPPTTSPGHRPGGRASARGR
ncbi:hypothetical protein PL81_21535 [Streptomyces sp. RSD-27]|nr:hypothetical protein PL81_21535 [Streptomyces sp. RSD-27]